MEPSVDAGLIGTDAVVQEIGGTAPSLAERLARLEQQVWDVVREQSSSRTLEGRVTALEERMASLSTIVEDTRGLARWCIGLLVSVLVSVLGVAGLVITHITLK